MGNKKIIIAEKPSVARTYAQILGVKGQNHDGYIENDEWIVTWCIGHLVTLAYPESYDEALKKWDMDMLPFLPQDYKYQIIKDVEKQFKIIKGLYNRNDIDTIYYAGDSGREGIYIQMLVRQEAGHNPKAKELVVWISSQTDEEVKRGVKEAKPLEEYKNLTDSGYMRAIEDYAMGINISRALSLKFRGLVSSQRPIAVGRVMSCVLGMVVNREREIVNFAPTKFYRIQSSICPDGEEITAQWKADKDSPLFEKDMLYNEQGFKKEQDATAFASSLNDTVTIEKVEEKEEKKYAPLLFNLAELQAACSRLLHISPDKTLETAQTLYEKKMTTYPRTDARVLSSAVAAEAGKNLRGLKNAGLGTDIDDALSLILSKGTGWIVNSHYTDDSKITDHYAIIPTGQGTGQLASLTDTEKKVYDMIVRRFVSIFMSPAIYKRLSIVETDGRERFYTSGSALVSNGFFDVAGVPEQKNPLPESASKLKPGDTYPVTYRIRTGETKPPSRYTSGSMILAMENAGNLIEDEELRAQIKGSGIGTSATRAEVIKKLVKLEYLSLNAKTQVLTPAPYGYCVYEIVNACVPALLNPEMTAGWEKGLQMVAEGKVSRDEYKRKLDGFVAAKVDAVKKFTITDDLTARLCPYKDKVTDKKPSARKVQAEAYLNVPYEDREKAKGLGAWWDGDRGAWYVPKGHSTEPFTQWLTDEVPQKKAKPNGKKTYLKVPYGDKDVVKRLGARWDAEKKQWYITSGQDRKNFVRWLKKN